MSNSNNLHRDPYCKIEMLVACPTLGFHFNETRAIARFYEITIDNEVRIAFYIGYSSVGKVGTNF